MLMILLLVQVVRYVGAKRLGRELVQVWETPAAAQRVPGKDLKDYQKITETGHLGSKKKPKSAQLFGILGEVALIGSSPADAKPFAVGAQVPGGEKLVEIRLNEVVLEKDGKRRTVTLFDPNLPTKPGRPHPTSPTPKPGPPARRTSPGAESAAPPPTGPPMHEGDREAMREKRRARRKDMRARGRSSAMMEVAPAPPEPEQKESMP